MSMATPISTPNFCWRGGGFIFEVYLVLLVLSVVWHWRIVCYLGAFKSTITVEISISAPVPVRYKFAVNYSFTCLSEVSHGSTEETLKE